MNEMQEHTDIKSVPQYTELNFYRDSFEGWLMISGDTIPLIIH